jgi:hypothetical protein
VVWVLNNLFTGRHADHLVFKGGTSLSKAWGVITRFSEDVDITYDIRAIADDLVGASGSAIPSTSSAARKWTDKIRHRLPGWIAAEIVPRLRTGLAAEAIPAAVSHENDQVFIEYQSMARGSDYVEPKVQLEFGARSTGEPAQVCAITCDAAEYIPEVEFPTAEPRVMTAQRTFWEKATAIHAFCLQGRFRGRNGFARHWHDVVRLDDAGIADLAIADESLARAVAEHKAVFFREKASDDTVVDYLAAVSGGLRLVPDLSGMATLRTDYQRMIEDDWFTDSAEAFDDLMKRCLEIEAKANR